MQAFIDRQMVIIEKWRHDHAEEVEKDNDCYKRVPELAAFCILDDVISDRVAVQWSKQLNYFFVNGRHLCCSVFITSQHVKGIGPMIRGNMDIICLQPIFQLAARMELHDMYAGAMDRNLFFQMMNCIVKDENLEGSTPQDPKKYVRTMFINGKSLFSCDFNAFWLVGAHIVHVIAAKTAHVARTIFARHVLLWGLPCQMFGALASVIVAQMRNGIFSV